MLGQDVERVGGHLQGLDIAVEHASHGDRAAQQIGAVLGEQHTPRHLAHLVPGAADPLQSTGHRRRRLHLHHQIHGAHIDPEFQAAGGHHAFEPPGLQIIFDVGALFLAYRAVMRPRQQGSRAVGLATAHDMRRRPSRYVGIGHGSEVEAKPLSVNLVEPGGKPLSEAA
ncbi:Uncharacterised protein [Mycobacteroides abscessus subsp. abscessus]|nr:Uncharacterised protein [Mycobacteroides abscessus subsp. abscessus]